MQEKYQNNPFDYWKKNITTPAYCISTIPFVRNLAEFAGYKDEFLKLTSLLHIKNDTDTLTLDELCTIYKKILADKQNLVLNPPARLVINVIIEEAESVLNQQEEAVELEGKIVLSIAIRLLAERHMIKVINNAEFVDGIKKIRQLNFFRNIKS